MNKIKIDMPVIVEGKYDLIKLNSIIDADIITTNGFGIFKDKEKAGYIKKLAEKKGVIVLTDGDGAGLVIRNHLKSVLPKEKIFNLYPPQIVGKEKRKAAPSKEGLLGVEGIDVQTLRRLFLPFSSSETNENTKKVTKLDFYLDGLSGGNKSEEKRNALERIIGVPCNISSNALLDAINHLYSYEEYKELIKQTEKDTNEQDN